MTQNVAFNFKPHDYTLCRQGCITAATSRKVRTGATQKPVICSQHTLLPVMYVKEQRLELPYK